MALKHRYGKIQNWQKVCISSDGLTYDPIYEKVYFSTMTIGINGITDDNHEKFYERIRLYELASNSLIARDVNFNSLINLEVIKKFIGLDTNANCKTDAEFKKFLLECLHAEAQASIRLEKRGMV